MEGISVTDTLARDKPLPRAIVARLALDERPADELRDELPNSDP